MTPIAPPRPSVPLVCAPMAGGPSTPELVAAVGSAGALGFLAAGNLTADALAGQIRRTRALTARPFGVNLFVPEPPTGADVTGFAERLQAYAATRPVLRDVAPGAAAWDDDAYADKLAIVLAERPAVASFTFGCPSGDDVERLHAVGISVSVTVTTAAEAGAAAETGADTLTVQGPDAGGHRGTHRVADEPSTTPLTDLLGTCAAAGLPMVAAGGLATAAAIRDVLGHGAVTAQLGTMFLLCPEAGTTAIHRRALTKRRDTVVTRAFSGRYARGLANGWAAALSEGAPAAYPEINRLTAPLRRAAAAAGDADATHLWAGTAHRRAIAAPAAEVVALLAAEL